MQKQFSGLAILILAVMVLSSRAYASDASQFDQQIQLMHAQRAQMVAKLGIDPQTVTVTPPEASCYYDDLEDHIEHVLLTMDYIDQGLR